MISSQVFLLSNKVSDAELARHLAITVIANYPEASSQDAIRIILT